MAKRLLGKEVTAALNERIKADAEALKAKGVNQLCVLFVLVKMKVIFLTKEEQQNVVKH